MIQLEITRASIDKVEEVINSKIAQLELIVSPTALTEIAKAVFTVTTKKFLDDLALAARQNPAMYHHLYEWGEVGNTAQRLFVIQRSKVQYGDLIMTIIPMQSVKPVPIPTVESEPGDTGRSVSARAIFRDKMEIMENDTPVHIITKRTIVFSPDGESLIFLPPGKTIDIMHPGGPQTHHALQDFSRIWFASKAEIAVEQSQLIRQIGNRVAATVNQQGSTPAQVYSTIRSVNQEYSKEITVR